jgi:hypothetical protein
MATNELALKFTNEIYATKQDVIKSMKTTLIDHVRNQIIEYRGNFMIPLSLKHITGTKYSVCLAPTISAKVSRIELKFLKLVASYLKLENNIGIKAFERLSYEKILSSVAKRYQIQVEEGLIDSIISKTVSVLPPSAAILNRYISCLKYIEDSYLKEISDEDLANFYSRLTGQEELTKFYRTTEIDNSYSRVLIDRLYLGIPTNAIESSMDELFNFLSYDQSTSFFVKAVASFYYGYYVRPFDLYNEDISLLLFKKILAKNDIGKVASLVDFETILEDKEGLENAILESQKSFDLTYLLNYLFDKVDGAIEGALSDMVLAENEALKEEFYDSEKEEKSTEYPVNAAKPAVEKPAIKPVVKAESSLNYEQSIAISNVPTGLSETEANRLAEHLIEMNPSLSRSQAYFYANHCTLGMNYTIAQFKKEMGCAYETARSSMDKLVSFGYYRKEVLKNKYIYTPVKRN